MKNASITLLLLILFIFTSYSQGIYSKENLEKSTQEDLALYLAKAQKLRKTGAFISITGASSVVLGSVMMLSNRETAGYMGMGVGLIGAGISIVGLPVLSAGSSRVKRVSKVWNMKYNSGLIDLKPGGFYNYHTQHIQPGISLKIRF